MDSGRFRKGAGRKDGKEHKPDRQQKGHACPGRHQA